jgi:hypothetical protein
VIAALHPGVDWSNGWEGGRIRGRDAVRAYWTRQFAAINPHVDPERITVDPAGRNVAGVHLIVRDPAGRVAVDEHVRHVYEITDGLIVRMDIEPA